ncbi:3-hydroxyacyl-CoA dehydrogenase NAD-binding domain-containing protein [Rhizobiaceae bacterium n13]|uniref:3-hydroxyacyl-CoA dehydrogenase NAD-binding domain-containing protein n=1 Tax=Ferirhizobium litorale TaxID=2927786 RepID=A0AAE3QFR7_9HYPH|nr:3-hydroxyacyl-CoA dehydrogenase NAD-binding domain-containing protein [Fererhizobium litorale]MDI7862796.1 3-hydroxyacyl-CoA dehydrogenase NAD-binding domain-containing protein [Fererhizobium litorale]MDI7924340.1 3-hydroxyacyl-CoA dehydrogenase NAD-binding domain-containing protein [Fererhizobium litorale]
MTISPNPIQHERRGSVAVVTIDYAPVNALSKGAREGLLAAVAEIAGDDTVKAAVIYGGAGRFIAGADLKEMSMPPDEPLLPDVVAAIDALDKPVVAAIDGAALGGGLEIALACDYRIAGPRAQVGLTETRLGLIPGAGGTQRLPRFVGIAHAIAMICEGRILEAADAMSIGIVEQVTDANLLDEAVEIAGRIGKRRVRELAVPAGDREAEDVAAKAALARAKGVPAIAAVMPIIRAARDLPFADGLALERAAFLRLRESSEAKALRHLFLAEREVWKVPGLEGVAPRAIAKVAVIGAGTMGAGIAVALADAGLAVSVLERDETAAAVGRDRVKELYEKQVKSGRISVETMAGRLGRLAVGADWTVLSGQDLVIEAAFEDMAVKVDIFRRLDELCRPGTILASNTSYLDLDQIAAVTKRPEDVVGLHFFSPANIMKLLEIVRGAKTSAVTLATALALAKRIGKIPVVAGNCDGFIGNRIYAVYRRHAEYLIEDGASPEEVDAALEAFGFAMGIFAVSDMSGLDIAYAMRKRRAATRDPGERYVAIADTLVEAGRLGRKTGAGWYAYDEAGRKSVDPVTTETIESARATKGIVPRGFTPEEIQRRLVAVMANEGAKVLAEGIALRSSDIDLAFVNGYGFPRLKGGPMKFADEIGLQTILTEVEAAYAAGGVGSEPAPLLLELARNGGIFATWRRN